MSSRVAPVLVLLASLGFSAGAAAQVADDSVSEELETVREELGSGELPVEGPGSALPPLSEEEAAALFVPEEPSYPQLSLYGFADFTFGKTFVASDNLVGQYIGTHSSFYIGNVNLYVDSQISRRARSLIEVRLSFLPNGVMTIDPLSARVQRVSTEVTDYRITGRFSQWATIGIERVVLSYDLTPWLTLTIGRLITPWGLWNIDHGTPSLITNVSPLFVDGQYIPTRQTGMQASGQWAFPTARLGYFLTLSNGRGPAESYRDLDENKAVGGRVFGSLIGVGELTLGFTFYVGHATNPISQFVRIPADGSRAYIDTKHEVRSFEKALGADLKWEYKGNLLLAEFVASGRTYDDAHRGLVDEAQGALVSDGRRQITSDSLRYGGYILVGHRFRFLGTMPFVNFEYNMDGESFLAPRLLLPQIGINMRPEPGLVLKAVGSMSWFKDAEARFFGENARFFGLHLQAAWAF